MAEPLRLTMSRRVNASPARVWDVAGDFGNEHRWTRVLKKCTRDRADVTVGTRRECELAKPMMGRTRVTEILTDYRPMEGFAYRLDGGIGPFESVESRWRFRADGDGTIVETEARLTPRSALARFAIGPLALAGLRWSVRGTLREFADFVEAGA